MLFLNFSLCLDLYLSFKTPFFPNRRRLTKYIIGSVAIVLLTLPATQGAVLESPKDLFRYFFEPLVIKTDKDNKIIMSKMLKTIVSKESTYGAQELDRVKWTNGFYM